MIRRFASIAAPPALVTPFANCRHEHNSSSSLSLSGLISSLKGMPEGVATTKSEKKEASRYQEPQPRTHTGGRGGRGSHFSHQGGQRGQHHYTSQHQQQNQQHQQQRHQHQPPQQNQQLQQRGGGASQPPSTPQSHQQTKHQHANNHYLSKHDRRKKKNHRRFDNPASSNVQQSAYTQPQPPQTSTAAQSLTTADTTSPSPAAASMLNQSPPSLASDQPRSAGAGTNQALEMMSEGARTLQSLQLELRQLEEQKRLAVAAETSASGQPQGALNRGGSSQLSSSVSQASYSSLPKDGRKSDVKIVPSEAASKPLCPATPIDGGSPQEFSPVAIDSEAESKLPQQLLPGTTATISLVGEVVAVGRLMMDQEVQLPFTTVTMKYSVPFSRSNVVDAQLVVRCYGDVLAQFASSVLVVGDVAHVSGHLLPMGLGWGGTAEVTGQAFSVCALPLGGNVTVVVPSAAGRRK